MEDDRTYSFFRFEDLRIYEKAVAYVEWVYNTTNLFPEIETTGGLAARFLKASQNIAINIADGSAKNKNQFITQLKEAKSAVRECVVITTIASRLKYISEETMDESREHLMEISKMMGALISSLQRGNNRRQQNQEREEVSEEKEEKYIN
ncbi:MAG: four helix bundle protein [Bacteroidales bacterium]|nr:four helix bundle protein [Bacteroidales bacterium]